ncbi:MAG: hypothetical protein WAX04_00385 [Oscillospiraceae bacterium]
METINFTEQQKSKNTMTPIALRDELFASISPKKMTPISLRLKKEQLDGIKKSGFDTTTEFIHEAINDKLNAITIAENVNLILQKQMSDVKFVRNSLEEFMTKSASFLMKTVTGMDQSNAKTQEKIDEFIEKMNRVLDNLGN